LPEPRLVTLSRDLTSGVTRSFGHDTVPRSRSQSWLPPFVALSAIWGSSFLFIKVADRAVPPVGVALVRVVVGAATLLCVLGVQRFSLPRGRRTWAHLAVVALIGNVLPFSLIAYGETQISSVLAGIWNATTPLLTLLVAMAILREERPTRSRTLGLAIGFVGVVCLLGPWSGLSGGGLLGSLACFGAAALYAIAFPYTRRYLTPLAVPAASLAAGQLVCASLELAVVTPLLDPHVGHVTPAVVGSLLALGALGTGIAYVLSYGLIQRAGATTASTVTYVIPVFATALGIIVLGESLQWNEPVGAAIVLLGVAISQGRLAGLAGARRQATAEAPG
jgi:drug/metabolite transporter (DMT)-like permease